MAYIFNSQNTTMVLGLPINILLQDLYLVSTYCGFKLNVLPALFGVYGLPLLLNNNKKFTLKRKILLAQLPFLGRSRKQQFWIK